MLKLNYISIVNHGLFGRNIDYQFLEHKYHLWSSCLFQSVGLVIIFDPFFLPLLRIFAQKHKLVSQYVRYVLCVVLGLTKGANLDHSWQIEEHNSCKGMIDKKQTEMLANLASSHGHIKIYTMFSFSKRDQTKTLLKQWRVVNQSNSTVSQSTFLTLATHCRTIARKEALSL